jgi:hypothetical protein
MTATFNGRIDLKVVGTYAVSIDLGTRQYNLSQTYTNRFANGAGVDQAQAIFTDTRTITASSSETLDLAALTDAFGNSIALTNVKCIIVQAHTDNVNNVVVGGAASNPFSSPFDAGTDTISVQPGGMICLSTHSAGGYAVDDSTAHNLKIANSGSGSSVLYDIIIIGDV